VLSETDWENIYNISKERYQNWEWNYGKSPAYNKKASHKFPSGLLDIRLDVKKGMIENCVIYGDFFGLVDGSVYDKKLISFINDKQAVKTALKDIYVSHYLVKITKEEFINLIY